MAFSSQVRDILRAMQLLSVDAFPPVLDAEQFWLLVGPLEHEQLDFKLKPTDRLSDTIAAMAMTDGGVVVLGISDDHAIVGCELNQRTLDRAMAAGHAVGVDIAIKALELDGFPVTVIGVPEVRGRIVTTTDGRLLRRLGSSTQPLIGDALGRFVRERVGHSAEEDSIPLAAIEDFDLDLVNRALGRPGRQRVRRDGLLRALVDTGVASIEPGPAGTIVSKAAALVFANDPRKVIPGAAVQIVRRSGVGPGPGPTTAREELSGPIPRLLDDVNTFIERHSPRYITVIGSKREIVPAYPLAAVREAVLNALAHRDYSISGSTVDITIWDDRMEIHSPGSLPGHITVENIREEHYSRNRRVMNILKTLRLVEEYGEGIDRMFNEMEARLIDPPTIFAAPASVTVTLYTRSLLTPEDQAWLALLGHLGLTPQERRILVMARRDGSVTPRRIRATIPDVDVDDLLAGAMAKGLLVRTGERGGTRYVLSDEVVLRAGASGLEARGRQRQMLLDEIRRIGSLSTQEASAFLDEPTSIVRHLLTDLVRARLVTADGQTRARRYSAAGGRAPRSR
jgi:ATP-dependent DNA helicase RecG